MTRKRFMKQLMRLGMGRNEAEKVAAKARARGSYQKELLWEACIFTVKKWTRAAKKTGNAFCVAAKAMEAFSLTYADETSPWNGPSGESFGHRELGKVREMIATKPHEPWGSWGSTDRNT